VIVIDEQSPAGVDALFLERVQTHAVRDQPSETWPETVGRNLQDK
jgi:hypothetical protein